jgi:hypothetical protein
MLSKGRNRCHRAVDREVGQDTREPGVRRRLEEAAGVLGMRFTFQTDLQRFWLTDGTADWLWDAAERAGIPLVILPDRSTCTTLSWRS